MNLISRIWLVMMLSLILGTLVEIAVKVGIEVSSNEIGIISAIIFVGGLWFIISEGED